MRHPPAPAAHPRRRLANLAAHCRSPRCHAPSRPGVVGGAAGDESAAGDPLSKAELAQFEAEGVVVLRDAVPGRLNERLLTIKEPGIYYGQCSELCGARHAYMPIAIEAVPMERWRQWVASKGGSFGEDAETSEAADIQAPASATEGAPAARERLLEGEI